MMRFWNRIAISSSLHEPVLIYESSYLSVFEPPVYRVRSEYESGSGPDLLLLGSDLRAGLDLTKQVCSRYNAQPNTEVDIQTHTYSTHMHVHG